MVNGRQVRKRLRAARLWLAMVLVINSPIVSLSQTPPKADLAQATLEELMNLQITSVSKKEQRLSSAPAAVFVITQDDIQRSGATNIPDVLRMAPGVNVARVDANAWAISIRGFSSRYSDKILVLVDGRSIYSPAFSGVYWDQINVPLGTIERIEVIRGPGGTVWGANAMNGVINIITKHAQDTQGGVLVVQAGSEEFSSMAQYGGRAGGNGTYRAFSRYFNVNSALRPNGEEAADGWHGFHSGFRWDLSPSSQDTVTIQGNLLRTKEGQTVTTVLSNRLPTVATFDDRVAVESGDFQARWRHRRPSGSEIAVGVYFDHWRRLDQGLVSVSDTLDVTMQHHVALTPRNDVVWGLDFRATNDRKGSGYNNLWFPPRRMDVYSSIFVQDEVRVAEHATLTVGTKVERNNYTGFEYEPSVQFIVRPTGQHTVWVSASQAIRQPARQDTDLQYDVDVIPLDAGQFGVVKLMNNKSVQAERVRSYEVGYRGQANKLFSIDVVAFSNLYKRLQTSVQGTPFVTNTPGPPHLVFPLQIENSARAWTYGGEVSAIWDVAARWRLTQGFSFLQMRLTQPALRQNGRGDPGDTPKHQSVLRSALGLRSNIDWDVSAYFVGELDKGDIPNYVRLDTQLRWRAGRNLELSIGGQNLVTARHTEFTEAFALDYTQVQRSVIGKVRWSF